MSEQNNQFQVFNHEQFGEITTIKCENDKILFKGNDVAKALGYVDYTKAITNHCKGVAILTTPSPKGMQPTRFITEADIYRLVMRSKLPAAEKFQDWVVEEVLPSIRKNGAYMTQETLNRAITEPDFLIQLATNLKKEQESRKLAEEKIAEQCAVIETQENAIVEMKDRAQFVNYILSNRDCYRITQIASEYGFSATKMNQLLAEYKIQRYVNGQWTLRTPYLSNSFMKSVTVNTPNGLFQSSMWTQEGRQFLYRFLKQKGYIPLYEKKQLEPKEKTLFDGINDQ